MAHDHSRALSPSSRGLGHHPFTVTTRVRIPLGTPHSKTRRSSAHDQPTLHCPYRLAWPRTPSFHGENAGSNPARDAKHNAAALTRCSSPKGRLLMVGTTKQHGAPPCQRWSWNGLCDNRKRLAGNEQAPDRTAQPSGGGGNLPGPGMGSERLRAAPRENATTGPSSFLQQ